MSRLTSSGHLVVMRVPDHLGLHARFVDEDQVRDLTGMCADLALVGALDRAERARDGAGDPDESVPAADLTWAIIARPVQWEVPSATWLHLPSGQGGDFTAAEALAAIARGVALEVTAGVAHEACVQDRDLADPQG